MEKNSDNSSGQELIRENNLLLGNSKLTTIATTSILYNIVEGSRKVYAEEFGRIDRAQLEFAWHQAPQNFSVNEIAEIFDYFFVKYYKIMSRKHESIGTAKLVEFLERIKYISSKFGTFPYEPSVDDYKAMIDYYFENLHVFKGNARGFDPLLLHFMSRDKNGKDRVRERCYFETRIRNNKNF